MLVRGLVLQLSHLLASLVVGHDGQDGLKAVELEPGIK